MIFIQFSEVKLKMCLVISAVDALCQGLTGMKKVVLAENADCISDCIS